MTKKRLYAPKRPNPLSLGPSVSSSTRSKGTRHTERAKPSVIAVDDAVTIPETANETQLQRTSTRRQLSRTLKLSVNSRRSAAKSVSHESLCETETLARKEQDANPPVQIDTKPPFSVNSALRKSRRSQKPSQRMLAWINCRNKPSKSDILKLKEEKHNQRMLQKKIKETAAAKRRQESEDRRLEAKRRKLEAANPALHHLTWAQYDPTKYCGEDIISEGPEQGMHRLPPREVVCGNCSALMYINERKKKSTKLQPIFTQCCDNGKIILPVDPEPPATILLAFLGKIKSSANVDWWKINRNLKLVYSGLKVNHRESSAVLECSGKLYQSIYPLFGKMDRFSQMPLRWTVDPNSGNKSGDGLSVNEKYVLHKVVWPTIKSVNWIAKFFAKAIDAPSSILTERNSDWQVSEMQRRKSPNDLQRDPIYQISGGDELPSIKRKPYFILPYAGMKPMSLSFFSPLWDALNFPVLYPYASIGWYSNMKKIHDKIPSLTPIDMDLKIQQAIAEYSTLPESELVAAREPKAKKAAPQRLPTPQLHRMPRVEQPPVPVTQDAIDAAMREIGFKNWGNTCWLNSFLQCILAIPSVRTIADMVNPDEERNEMLLFIYTLRRSMRQAASESIASRESLRESWKAVDAVVREFRLTLSATFAEGQMQSIMDIFDLIMQRAEGSQLLNDARFSRSKTLICATCFKVRTVEEPSLYLSARVPHNLDFTSSYDLSYIMEPLQQIYPDHLQCDQCDARTHHSCRDDIPILPEVLLIHIQRSYFHENSAIKYVNHIKIPDGSIQVGRSRYALCSVAHHLGESSNAGHYTSTVADSDNRFTYFSDSQSQPASQDMNEITHQAELLFLRRIESPAIEPIAVGADIDDNGSYPHSPLGRLHAGTYLSDSDSLSDSNTISDSNSEATLDEPLYESDDESFARDLQRMQSFGIDREFAETEADVANDTVEIDTADAEQSPDEVEVDSDEHEDFEKYVSNITTVLKDRSRATQMILKRAYELAKGNEGKFQRYFDNLKDLIERPTMNERHDFYHRAASAEGSTKKDFLSLRKFTNCKLYERTNEISLQFIAGRLFQEFVMQDWCRIEDKNLSFEANRQKHLKQRSVNLEQIDSNNPEGLSKMGKKTYLSSSHYNSEAYRWEKFRDWCQLLAKFGLPTYFLTFTCNKNWPEFQAERINGIQTHCESSEMPATDRPDIISRVWSLKVEAYKKLIREGKIFGEVIADIHVTEYQQSSYPHLHSILWMKDEYKPRTPADVDRVINARLPTEPKARKLVETFMMHGPCENFPCSKTIKSDGTCQKGFPKPFQAETTYSIGADAIYKRPDDGEVFQKNGAVFTNQHVVPHNLSLLYIFNAHVYCDLVMSTNSVKYLIKYVCKGASKQVGSLSSKTKEGELIDEIAKHQEGRQLTATEAVDNIRGESHYCCSHSVSSLAVHLEGKQRTVITENITEDRLIELRSKLKSTMLTEFFKYNAGNFLKPGFQPTTYLDFPQSHTWNTSLRQWSLRKRNIAMDKRIWYLPQIPFADGETYYLRLLLKNALSPKSYNDVKTVNGIVMATFAEAARASGLTMNDQHIIDSMIEVTETAMPRQCRLLFATFLSTEPRRDSKDLWTRFRSKLCEDYMKKCQLTLADEVPAAIENYALLKIDQFLGGQNCSVVDFGLAPEPLNYQQVEEAYNQISGGRLRQKQLRRINESKDFVLRYEGLLDKSQLAVYKRLLPLIGSPPTFKDGKKLFFIDSPAGSGKTFVLNILINKAHTMGKNVLVCSSSGIAASLLCTGRTAHTTFRIPLKITSSSICSIEPNTQLAKQILKCDMIIFDECPMTSHLIFKAINDTIQDLFEKDNQRERSQKPFGSIPVVFSGDWRQTLPVDSEGFTDESAVSIKKSSFWPEVTVLKLTENNRVRNCGKRCSADGSIPPEFVEWEKRLLRIGNGEEISDSLNSNEILITGDQLSTAANRDEFLDSIYKPEMYCNPHKMAESCILTPKHVDVKDLNDAMVENIRSSMIKARYASGRSEAEMLALDSEIRDYASINHYTDSNGDETTSEAFDNYNHYSLPANNLKLHVGCIVHLLRNFGGYLGLANGTRCVVKALRDNYIVLEVVSATYRNREKHMKGPLTFTLPRIRLISTEDVSGFFFHRIQFPVCHSYAVTCHKSQGQTLQKVGLYLPLNVFAHGMMYTSMSRVPAPSDLKIYIPPKKRIENEDGSFKGYVLNVVNKAILT